MKLGKTITILFVNILLIIYCDGCRTSEYIFKGNKVEGARDIKGSGLYKIWRNDKYGMINSQGKVIVDFKYDNIGYEISEGLIKFKLNDKYGFIDSIGNEIISNFYEDVSDFQFNRSVVTLNNKEGAINKDNKIIVPIVYEEVRTSKDCFIVKSEGKYGVLDIYGQIMIPLKYNYIEWGKAFYLNAYKTSLDYDKEYYYMKSGSIDFFDKNGKIKLIIDYEKFQDFTPEGLATVCRRTNSNGESKWGYINLVGKEVIPLKYDDALPFNFGYGRIALGSGDNEKWGLINKYGKEITPVKYSFIREFKESRSIVSINNNNESQQVQMYDPCLYGAINEYGKEITELKYHRMEDFENGKSKVEIHDSMLLIKRGYVDLSGREYLNDLN